MFVFIKASLQVLEDATTSLWFSGKELIPDKKMEAFVGKNEKTKLIVKLQKVGISECRIWSTILRVTLVLKLK